MSDPWAELEKKYQRGAVDQPQSSGDPWADLEAKYSRQPQATAQQQEQPISAVPESLGGRLAASAGSALTDLWLGAKQRGNEMLAGEQAKPGGQWLFNKMGYDPQAVGKDLQQQVVEKRAMDKPLLDAGGGTTGRVLGYMGAAIPTMLIPGAATLGGSMAAGMGMGALDPTAQGESVAKNALAGGAGGAAGYGVAKALGAGINQASKLFSKPSVNLDAAARIAEAKQFGIDLTKGQATRDPAQWAFERNIRGVDGAGKPVLDRYTQQNEALIQAINKIGAGKGAGDYATGQQAISALASKDASRKAVVNQAYDYARNSLGAEAQLNGARLMDSVAKRMEESYLGDVLPSGIRKAINDFGSGAAPLTVGKAEQITRAINQQYGSDKVANLALDHVKQAIQEEMAQIGEQAGKQAASAFRSARGQAASRFNWQEAVPAAKAVADGVATPDAFIRQFVMNGSVKDVTNTMAALPLKERVAVQNQVLDAIKAKALSGAQDETGAFSQAGFNRALQSIGREKIAAVVGQSKANNLFALGRVAELTMKQPANATVSSSNSNVPLMNMLRQTTSLPVLGPNVTKPVMEGISRYQVSQALAPNAGKFGGRQGLMPASAQEELIRRLMPQMYGPSMTSGLLGYSPQPTQ